MEHFSNGAILKWSNSQIEHFSNGAILKWSNSQMEQFSNRAFLKWSNSQMEQFSNAAFWGRHPMPYFKIPRTEKYGLQCATFFQLSNLSTLVLLPSSIYLLILVWTQEKRWFISGAIMINLDKKYGLIPPHMIITCTSTILSYKNKTLHLLNIFHEVRRKHLKWLPREVLWDKEGKSRLFLGGLSVSEQTCQQNWISPVWNKEKCRTVEKVEKYTKRPNPH